MLRRNLLIGSLVAGVFVLPTLANAGVVQGPCVNCHTMHATNGDGVNNPTQNAQLLLGSGCVGCHTTGTNDANGVDLTQFGAPQISDATNVLSGGYFAAGAVSANVHNITDGAYYAIDGTLGIVPPGGAGAAAGNNRVAGIAAGGLVCNNCHDAVGGHHGTSTDYRLLTGVTGTPSANYGVQNAAVAAGVGNRSANAYDSSMNTFCADCHGLFHGADQTNGEWIRHPTDIAVAINSASIETVITPALGGDQTPVSTTTVVNGVMCLSCHVPHGGPRADLLAFTYSAAVNAAGDAGLRSTGCETCHSYGANGM